MTSSSRPGSGPPRKSTYRAAASVPSQAGSPPRRSTTYGGKRPTRPSGPPRGIVIALVISLFFTLAGVGVWAYAKSLNDDLNRFDAFDGLEDRPEKVVDGSLNILVLGSDSRNPDSTEGSRADTIMMLHIPTNGKNAYIISLPRDLWVPIPPSPDGSWGGGEEKLNASMAFGGIPLIVSTVEGYTGVRLDHVLEIDFNGLKSVVNALGGVEMDVEMDITSIHKPYREFQQGKQTMDGETALDYVRQRKQFPEGDFARMRHQQQLLMSMMDKATQAGILASPSKLNEFLGSVIGAVKVDQEFDLIATGLQFSNLRSEDLVFMTSPHLGTGWVGDQSVVLADTDLAPTMYDAIKNGKLSDWLKEHPDAVKNA